FPNTPFPKPDGIKHVQISKASGLLPGDTTPSSMIIEEVFAEKFVPTETENLFFTVKIDKVSRLLATEFTPPDAVEEVVYQNYQDIADMFNWNNEIKEYYEQFDSSIEPTDPTDPENPVETIPLPSNIRFGLPPTEYDNIHTANSAENVPSIKIISPENHSKIPKGLLKMEMELEAPNGVKVVEYYVDDNKVYTTSTPPYIGSIIISKFFKNNSAHLIRAKIIDVLGYSAESVIEVSVVESD
ncbi:MAG: Ig-like domain-containing protein, partial [Candidatus Gracilibacteria bacterium]|nr:Ig-like domain-containing protein [Candidatus Gracilibacteria bacterium]